MKNKPELLTALALESIRQNATSFTQKVLSGAKSLAGLAPANDTKAAAPKMNTIERGKVMLNGLIAENERLSSRNAELEAEFKKLSEAAAAAESGSGAQSSEVRRANDSITLSSAAIESPSSSEPAESTQAVTTQFQSARAEFVRQLDAISDPRERAAYYSANAPRFGFESPTNSGHEKKAGGPANVSEFISTHAKISESDHARAASYYNEHRSQFNL